MSTNLLRICTSPACSVGEAKQTVSYLLGNLLCGLLGGNLLNTCLTLGDLLNELTALLTL